MNKIIFHITVINLLFIISLEGFSQTFNKGMIRVIPHEVEQRGEELLINIDFDITGLRIEADRSLTLTPVLISSTHQLSLPEVIINGRRRHKSYSRLQSLSSKSESLVPYYEVLKAGSKSEKIINYTLSIPFEEWMKDSRLDLKEDLCGCAGKSQEVLVERLVNRVLIEYVIPYDIVPSVCYIRPDIEPVKNRSEEVEVFLDFPVAKTIIYPEFGNNPKELLKIESAIKEISTDKNIELNQIYIAGYASPEGSVSMNNKLSEGRAQALRNYLSQRTNFSPGIYRIEHGGEDWEGLKKMVEESKWVEREEILNILNSVERIDERKYRIRLMNEDRTYQRLLKEFYPSLRRVVCRMEYVVRGFSPEEGRDVFKVRPHQLSLEEMFLVANTYPIGSENFMDVFDTAVRMYPEDEVANLNAAATALMKKDIKLAERYLELSNKNTPEYLNNLGLLNLLKEEYDTARVLLKKAENKGVKEATRNLEELEKKLDESSRIERR